MNTPLAAVTSIDASDGTTPMPYPTPSLAAPVEAINDGRWQRWPNALRGAGARVQHWIRSLGPYVAIELLLPGGTIIALVLWAYRQRRAASADVNAVITDVAPVEPRARLKCATSCGQR